MQLRIVILLILLFQCSTALPVSAFDALSNQAASKLDLAMVRLNHDLLRYRVENNSKDYSAFRVFSAYVIFIKQKNKIMFRVSVVAEPTDFSCKLAIKSLMNFFNVYGQSDQGAKIFYSRYFMPESVPMNSYDVNLYASVYENILFNVKVLDKEYEPRLSCASSGSDSEVRFSPL